MTHEEMKAMYAAIRGKIELYKVNNRRGILPLTHYTKKADINYNHFRWVIRRIKGGEHVNDYEKRQLRDLYDAVNREVVRLNSLREKEKIQEKKPKKGWDPKEWELVNCFKQIKKSAEDGNYGR